MSEKFANTPGKRFLKLTGMTAKIAGQYTRAQIKNRLQSDDNDKEQNLSAMYGEIGDVVLQTLGEMKGAAMKVGQIISQMRHLFPPEFAERISQLQQSSPAMPYAVISKQIQSQLGYPPEKLFKQFDKEPFAAASIGQVHKAITRDNREIVVKVQYPGVYESCQSDLLHLKRLFALSGLMKVDKETLDEVFATLQKSLFAELDYQTEADNLRYFREFHQGHDKIIIPEVIGEYTTERVLSLSYEPGDKMEDLESKGYSQDQVNALAVTLVEAVLREVLYNDKAHSDPHPGNFAFRKDGTVIIYDYGCVNEVTDFVIDHYIEIIYAGIDGQFDRIDEMLLKLGVRNPDEPAVDPDIYRQWHEDFIRPALELEDVGKTIGMIQAGINKHMPEFIKLRGVFQPAADTIFLSRIITGHFLNLAQMKVNVDIKPVIKAHLFEEDGV